jgi:hypothetical protein
MDVATSVGSVLRAVKEIEAKWEPDPSSPQELWFRGVTKKTHSLLPQLYRPLDDGSFYPEEDLFESFKAQAAYFAPPTVLDDWDWYVLAQHHHLPTRLLDWTESVLAAVYFAVRESIETLTRREYDELQSGPRRPETFDDDSPAIWVLEASSLNNQTKPMEAVFALGDEATEAYLPDNISKRSDRNRLPVAILPPRANSRIIAQRGVFTIHGHDRRSIDAIAALPDSSIRLERIVLDRANLAHIWSELEYARVDRLALFPELDSVSFQTAWSCRTTATGE